MPFALFIDGHHLPTALVARLVPDGIAFMVDGMTDSPRRQSTALAAVPEAVEFAGADQEEGIGHDFSFNSRKRRSPLSVNS